MPRHIVGNSPGKSISQDLEQYPRKLTLQQLQNIYEYDQHPNEQVSIVAYSLQTEDFSTQTLSVFEEADDVFYSKAKMCLFPVRKGCSAENVTTPPESSAPPSNTIGPMDHGRIFIIYLFIYYCFLHFYFPA